MSDIAQVSACSRDNRSWRYSEETDRRLLSDRANEPHKNEQVTLDRPRFGMKAPRKNRRTGGYLDGKHGSAFVFGDTPSRILVTALSLARQCRAHQPLARCE